VVVSPTTLSITIAGTVTVQSAQLATATSAITTVIQNYIAGLGPNAIIRLSTITELIMQVSGVVDITGLTINGVASNLTLGSSTTYTLAAYPPAIALTYVTQ
jgi:uncharacterized phage protein gp47/JayE